MALAPALRRLPALEGLYLDFNPFGDEGLAALVRGAAAAGTRSAAAADWRVGEAQVAGP